MEFQIYLSGRVQRHFGLGPKILRPDSEVEPARGWWVRWRIEFLISNGDGSQHLFLATNEGSYYSFVIPLFDDKGLDELVSVFFHYWLDALVRRGFDAGEEIPHEAHFLKGRPSKLIGVMNQFVMFASDAACAGEDVAEMHRRIRRLPTTKGSDYILPGEEFEQLLETDPPYPSRPPGPKIVPFPSPN